MGGSQFSDGYGIIAVLWVAPTTTTTELLYEMLTHLKTFTAQMNIRTDTQTESGFIRLYYITP
jgi:hypothetical protein